MNIVSVIPIKRGITKEELTYYSTEIVRAGDIVSVPMRKKNIPALVTSVSEVRTKKASIKSAGFSVRKITRVHAQAPFSQAFMNAIKTATTYFACSTGAILNSVIPKAILTKPTAIKQKTKLHNTSYEIRAIQDTEETRYAYYKSLVRELFAKKQSIIFVLPTRTEAENFFETLKRGITEHALLLHTGLSQKAQREVWHRALDSSHPLLIVSTPMFLSLPRSDIGSIVIEHEDSRHYKTNAKPYMDYRTFAHFFAEFANVPIIFGSELLRLETLQDVQTHTITPVSQPNMRYPTEKPSILVDMRTDPEKQEKNFQVVSSDLEEMIRIMKEPSDRCFIYTLRKGLYTLTLCRDCGNLVTCKNCNTPVVVHTQGEKQPNVFVCHNCNSKRGAEERCTHCDSWNLVPLGIGSQRVEQELAERLPDTTIFHIDTDAMTPARIQQMVKKWSATPKAILIGTEGVLPFIQQPSHIAVASMDTLFALPDFRARERMMRTFLFLRNRAERIFLIQTRNPDDIIFNYIKSGNLLSWFQEELQERKNLHYPPFSTLIKITTASSAATLPKHIAFLEEKLEEYKPKTFPAFTPRARGKEVLHTLISLPKGSWPDKKLVEILQKLPPLYAIHIDPEHLL